LALAGAIKHADLEAGAISSAVEHSLHTGGVAGSIPASPTKIFKQNQCQLSPRSAGHQPNICEQMRNDATLRV
jgi:hypothetical protein